MRTRNVLASLTLLAGLLLASAPQTAQADHGLPALQPQFLDYTPIGYYGPADEAGTPAGESATVPNPSGGPPPLNDPNPSGKWVAYDTDVWESLTMPYRHPGDNCNSLAPEDRHPDCLTGDMDDDTSNPAARTGYTGYQGPTGTSVAHGTCPPHPEIPGPWGQCFNNQLEYLDYYEHSMETSFADLGLIVKRYPFESPGGGTRGASHWPHPAARPTTSPPTIPGADHPEETVLVGAHYDFTDSGPAAAWDSAEGHTEVMRMAYIMADYYRETGTRPSATLKFVPWDSEESGSHGSQHYVDNNIPPGEFDEVRGYFNVDPCAGAYPAFEEGTNSQRNQVMQLANPAAWNDQPAIKSRIESFNANGRDHHRQRPRPPGRPLTRPGGTQVPIFVSDAEDAANADDVGSLGGAATDRDKIVTAVGGLALFTSDYANFEEVGIPVFNFFPGHVRPARGRRHQPEGSAGASSKGLEILHTNNDNLTRINRLTSGLTPPATSSIRPGRSPPKGWAKGDGVLRPGRGVGDAPAGDGGGPDGQRERGRVLRGAARTRPSATRPSRSTRRGRTSTPTPRRGHKRPESVFTYQWDFGDGTTGDREDGAALLRGGRQVRAPSSRSPGSANAKPTP